MTVIPIEDSCGGELYCIAGKQTASLARTETSSPLRRSRSKKYLVTGADLLAFIGFGPQLRNMLGIVISEVHMQNSRERVPAHTEDSVNERIRRETEERVQFLNENPGEIPQRFKELDDEWDIERAIEANAAALAFAGVTLAATHDKRWLILPGLVTAFLFQHAIQGWCPPVPILRRLGFRTAYEIEEERQALKALRGDFDRLPRGGTRGLSALQIARSA